MYKTSSIADINICLNNLSLINTISLYATIYFSVLVDALSILLTAFCKFYGSVELIIGALTAVYVSISINFKSDDSIQSLSRIFEYTISTRVFSASYTYRYTDRLLFSTVATFFSSVTALFVLQNFSSILSNAGDILSIRSIALYSEFQAANIAINISLCNSVCYLGSTTNITNNLLQSLYISDQQKSQFYQTAIKEDYKQLQRQKSVLYRHYSCSLLKDPSWTIY